MTPHRSPPRAAARRAPVPGLQSLARLWGVQTVYRDAAGARRAAPPGAILAVLSVLGATVRGPADVPAALRERRRALWSRAVEPVVVTWDGAPLAVELQLPAAAAGAALDWRLALEGGDERRGRLDLSRWPALASAEIDGVPRVRTRVVLPGALPPGYHRLALDAGGRRGEAAVVSAPRRAFAPEMRAWGIVAPLYALRSGRNLGVGDLTDLESLAAWAGGLGGEVVGTLPLLAAFLGEPFDPSPYAPASRLFWNDLYVDLARAPEMARCPRARDLLSALQAARGALRAGAFIDYRRQAARRRAVLAELARCFFAGRGPRGPAFERFLAANPRALDYARFRAAGDRLRSGWPSWPRPLRDGAVAEGDYDENDLRRHLYAQWLAAEQFTAVAEAARSHGVRLYLDLPLGVHPDGYDVWRERDAFAVGVAAGAPPDAFFTKGQNWGFPPLHPHRLRDQGHRYLIDALRHHLRHAGVLRIDHVMGLHRLFWIPPGAEARDGVYVRYPADELYAIVALESQRHRCAIAGEDLGTVPRGVRAAMQRHGVLRTYVMPFSASTRRGPAPPPAESVAALNTHDMPTFAGFWQGSDVADRVSLGLLAPDRAERELAGRASLRRALVAFLRSRGLLDGSDAPEAVLLACLAFLGRSPARVVLAGLEDLWLETAPQNVPGTTAERPNWRRRAGRTVEQFSRDPSVLAALRALDDARRRR